MIEDVVPFVARRKTKMRPFDCETGVCDTYPREFFVAHMLLHCIINVLMHCQLSFSKNAALFSLLDLQPKQIQLAVD